jgi:hypothetical protein
LFDQLQSPRRQIRLGTVEQYDRIDIDDDTERLQRYPDFALADHSGEQRCQLLIGFIELFRLSLDMLPQGGRLRRSATPACRRCKTPL